MEYCKEAQHGGTSKHDAKWKEPVIKDNILHGPIYRKYPEQKQIVIKQEWEWWDFFFGWENVFKLSEGDGCMGYSLQNE